MNGAPETFLLTAGNPTPTTAPIRPTIVRAYGNTRSTQSFVYIMTSVWKRPGLPAIEIAWRWFAAGPFLFLLYRWGLAHLPALQSEFFALQTLTLIRPVESLATLRSTAGDFFALIRPLLTWLAPLALFVWTTFGTIGQTVILRRLQPDGRPVPFALFGLRLLRSLGVFACWLLWTRLFSFAANIAITRPAASGSEPSAVLFLAMLIVGSILIFVGWGAVSWPVTLATVLATRQGTGLFNSLGQAFRVRKLRGQVAEVNLVLCIVKIALLVLALVFSACPLPFSSVETTQFLVNWTIGVALWYLVMSDVFHVIRLAAFAALAEAEKSSAA